MTKKGKRKSSNAEEISQLKDYIEFLKKRLASKNYRKNVSQEDHDKAKAKYDKAKFRLRLIKDK